MLLQPPLLQAAADTDYLDDAERLLRVSKTQQHFQSMTSRQVRDILRTYTSIVAMEVDVNLPRHLTASIADCYTETYAWENFEPGIALILQEQLSHKEILILIDFYRDLGMPPSDIQAFKDTIAKAPVIQQVSADYIFANSEGCVEKDATLIYHYLDSLQQSPVNAAAEP